MPLQLDRTDVRLLLDVLESPTAAISGVVLADHFPQQTARLMAANLLEPRGNVLVVPSLADHEDEPVTLTWSPRHAGYGYFSPTAGWVAVPPERLAMFGVNIPAVLSRMLVRFDLTSRGGPEELVSHELWEVGEARVGRARGRLPIWFGRRLYDDAVWEPIAEAAARRPFEKMRVLLTSTAGRRPPRRALPGHLIVAVEDVLDHAEPLSINPGIVAARIQGTVPPDIQGRLYLSPDGQTLTIDGNVTFNFKAASHIEIVRQLVAGHRTGKRFKAGDLLPSDSSAKTLEQAFGRKRWKQLQPFLESENGLWGFHF